MDIPWLILIVALLLYPPLLIAFWERVIRWHLIDNFLNHSEDIVRSREKRLP